MKEPSAGAEFQMLAGPLDVEKRQAGRRRSSRCPSAIGITAVVDASGGRASQAGSTPLAVGVTPQRVSSMTS